MGSDMTSATVRAENLFGKVGRGIRRKSGETFIEPYAFDRGCYLAPGLLCLMSTSDDFGLDKVAVPLLGVYFGALAVRGLVGLYRALLLRRWRLEFERTRVPLDGLAVRKYKHTYSVPDSDGSHDVTDLIVVVAVSATGMAREFSVPERVYDTVQEGQTRVRALSGWQTREPVRFELLA
jgi:hypothetical protein